jgi:hypothetical protein
MSGFTKDTPLLIQNGDEIKLFPISQLPGLFDIYIKDCENQLILFQTKYQIQNEKDLLQGRTFPYIITPLQDLHVWTDKGFTKIKQVIKQFYPRSNLIYHNPHKLCYHVTTESSHIDLTENQHLLTHDKQPIFPKDMKVGTTLYHSNPQKQQSESKTSDTITEIKTTPFFRDFVYQLVTEHPRFSVGMGQQLITPSLPENITPP